MSSNKQIIVHTNITPFVGTDDIKSSCKVSSIWIIIVTFFSETKTAYILYIISETLILVKLCKQTVYEIKDW